MRAIGCYTRRGLTIADERKITDEKEEKIVGGCSDFIALSLS